MDATAMTYKGVFYTVETWFERDRANVALHCDQFDDAIIDLWDDAVSEASEDGFIRLNRGTEALLSSLIEWAESRGLLPEALDGSDDEEELVEF